ncbi:hypothetical protein [Sphingomonas sp.]|uniref:hypothetical protein n=1 Tax=Sphingomonas sp. TaxID=28214 RepID=UPI0025D705F2|nr:hypothetical protein [Sphingomonas sp.]
MPTTDVSEGVDNRFVREDSIRRYQVVDGDSNGLARVWSRVCHVHGVAIAVYAAPDEQEAAAP